MMFYVTTTIKILVQIVIAMLSDALQMFISLESKNTFFRIKGSGQGILPRG